MAWGRIASRMAVVSAVVLGCGSAAAVSGPGPAIARDDATAAVPGMPAPIWQDVRQIQILCLINSDQGVVAGELHDRLCARVRDLAAAGAPAPVRVAAFGDPAIMQPDSLTLLVHVSISGAGGDRLAALAVRPWRNDPASGMLFAAAPRAARVGSDPLAALEPALRAAIIETIPWAGNAHGNRETD